MQKYNVKCARSSSELQLTDPNCSTSSGASIETHSRLFLSAQKLVTTYSKPPLSLFSTTGSLTDDPFGFWKYVDCSGTYVCPVCKRTKLDNVHRLLIKKKPLHEDPHIYEMYFRFRQDFKYASGICAIESETDSGRGYMVDLYICCSKACLEILTTVGDIE